jgi:hypothetical protein
VQPSHLSGFYGSLTSKQTRVTPSGCEADIEVSSASRHRGALLVRRPGAAYHSVPFRALGYQLQVLPIGSPGQKTPTLEQGLAMLELLKRERKAQSRAKR